jgi:hypothetical protein
VGWRGSTQQRQIGFGWLKVSGTSTDWPPSQGSGGFIPNCHTQTFVEMAKSEKRMEDSKEAIAWGYRPCGYFWASEQRIFLRLTSRVPSDVNTTSTFWQVAIRKRLMTSS